jgi:hypothetical protein
VEDETLIVPTVESEGGLRDLDAIVALDGIQLVWLAARRHHGENPAPTFRQCRRWRWCGQRLPPFGQP